MEENPRTIKEKGERVFPEIFVLDYLFFWTSDFKKNKSGVVIELVRRNNRYTRL